MGAGGRAAKRQERRCQAGARKLRSLREGGSACCHPAPAAPACPPRCILMEGSLVESHAVLAPGSVLGPGRRVPSGQLWGGAPAKYVRDLTKDEVWGPGGRGLGACWVRAALQESAFSCPAGKN